MSAYAKISNAAPRCSAGDYPCGHCPLGQYVAVFRHGRRSGRTAGAGAGRGTAARTGRPPGRGTGRGPQHAGRDLLTATDLTYVPLEAQDVLSSHIRREPIDAAQEQEPPSVIGAVTRIPFLAGMPLTDAGLIRPGQDGFLAAVLLPDRRAITITVNQETSHAGMIAPGDRVDVIFTMQVAPADPSQLNSFSRTVLEDIRVVAVGRRIESVNYADQEGGRTPQDDGNTVTLEVRPPEADQLVLASTRGSLALALRPLGQADDTSWRTPVGLNRLLPPPATEPPTPDPVRIQVFRGTEREEVLLDK